MLSPNPREIPPGRLVPWTRRIRVKIDAGRRKPPPMPHRSPLPSGEEELLWVPAPGVRQGSVPNHPPPFLKYDSPLSGETGGDGWIGGTPGRGKDSVEWGSLFPRRPCPHDDHPVETIRPPVPYRGQLFHSLEWG